jgi:hypothetical protein
MYVKIAEPSVKITSALWWYVTWSGVLVEIEAVSWYCPVPVYFSFQFTIRRLFRVEG